MSEKKYYIKSLRDPEFYYHCISKNNVFQTDSVASIKDINQAASFNSLQEAETELEKVNSFFSKPQFGIVKE